MQSIICKTSVNTAEKGVNGLAPHLGLESESRIERINNSFLMVLLGNAIEGITDMEVDDWGSQDQINYMTTRSNWWQFQMFHDKIVMIQNHL